MKSRHGLIAIFFLLAALTAAIPIFAQPAATGPAADAPAVVATADEEVTPEMLAEQAQKIVDDWEALGWMGGTIAIIGLLLLLLRYKPIDDLLEEHELKWVKPWVAATLGALLGFFQCFITGKGWAVSIISGLIAGIATPGLHQLLTKGNKK